LVVVVKAANLPSVDQFVLAGGFWSWVISRESLWCRTCGWPWGRPRARPKGREIF